MFSMLELLFIILLVFGIGTGLIIFFVFRKNKE